MSNANELTSSTFAPIQRTARAGFALDQGAGAARLRSSLMYAESPIVLLVDDDEAVRSAVAFALNVEGFSVRSFANPTRLLAEPFPEQECLLVTDYRMPDVDGLELIERLRSRRPDLPIILMSGLVNKALRKSATRLGVGAILEKPLNGSNLAETIRDVFHGRA